jgi:molybdopterin-guanine dinucleotide biosynthesis protein A
LAVIGAVLAGGAGRRMAALRGAGSKAAVPLLGRPLAAYPVEALASVCERVAIVCKRETELPPVAGAERWDEPDEPRHPLTGIVFALERAGEPVLVCAADMPFVTPDACRSLVTAAAGGGGGGPAHAVVAVAAGILQPVLGLYALAALDHLRSSPAGEPLTATVEGLDPVRVALPPPVVESVDTPGDLAAAEAALRPAGAAGA